MRLPDPAPARLVESRGERMARLWRGHGLFALVFSSWLLSLAGLWLFNGLLVWSAGLLYVLYDTALLAYVAWRTRDLRVLPAPSTPDARPTIGVIIAARNERNILPACLRALQAQTDRADRILVVDDGSTDDTLALLHDQFALVATTDAAQASAAALSVFSKPHSGKARSLNEGLCLLDTDVIITIDADTLLAPRSIAALRSAFAHEPRLASACGVLRPRCTRGLSARIFEWFQTFEYLRAFLSREAWVRSEALLLVSGAFAGFRREALLRVGGFDPHSRVEDYELLHRLHRHSHDHGLGWQVRVVSEAYAETDAPASLAAFLHQRQRWFAGFLETLFANRDMIGSRHYGSVGRVMLPVKVIDTLQPVFGVTAFLLLCYFVITWQPVLPLVLLTILIKLGIDIVYHSWSVYVYHRWLGRRVSARTWQLAIAAALAEPFSFQLLRHCGAVLGWLSFLRRRNDWVPQASHLPDAELP